MSGAPDSAGKRNSSAACWLIVYADGVQREMMDDRTRYETVKSRLRVMAQGTAQQVHDAMEPSAYSLREVESTLDEIALAEQDEFGKVGDVYRWKKHYRFRQN